MTARNKINAIVIAGTLVVAAIAGVLTESLLVFSAITIVGTVLMIYAGEVRLRPGDQSWTTRHRRRRRPSKYY